MGNSITQQAKEIIEEKKNLDLIDLNRLDEKLFMEYSDVFQTSKRYNRQLVSFQANKKRPIYRWYKYKEAFSARLVETLLLIYKINGKILDPFAGIGTTLFASRDMSFDADGIELLPIAQEVISSRMCLEKYTDSDFSKLSEWLHKRPWESVIKKIPLSTLGITKGAYPANNLDFIEKYLYAISEENDNIKKILRFALLCILESISYTRKDGQYLRWDYRANRRRGKREFNKGEILNFTSAIINKLEQIIVDSKSVGLQSEGKKIGNIDLLNGSSLEILPNIKENVYDAILTSPPYCNRYDYTRTYALELALLGMTESELSALRQNMLSATVENREKELLMMNINWEVPLKVAGNQELLQSILSYLEKQKELKKLNNTGIPRMIRGYFYEMACIIYECYRVLKKDAFMFTVNDNVRYAGVSISVDMILSDMAKKMGFKIENIMVLPKGKGNSSQQMGTHGRKELRKCIYVWRKT